MQAQPEKERRYFPRWEVDSKALYRCETDLHGYECHTVDLNSVGACIYTKQSLQVDQKVKLTIYLANDISIHVRGKVLWVKPEATYYLVGVQFQETSRDVQNLILSHAFEFRHDDVVNYWFKGWDD